MAGYAWVTLATNDAYSLGALVLAHSLRRVGTKHELAVLITPGVTEMMRNNLAAVFSVVQEVNVLDSKDQANLALLARPELGITFTKLHCWRLTQYEKCVFLDADTLVVRNCDELFEREELSAAPDVGWPDCFNSGVFVFAPSQQTFASITAFAAAKGSFDGGDQGLLNMYFSDWAHKDISKHLPFIYNMSATATYSYLPAFKQYGEDVRIIHFIGITKPWLQYFDTLSGIVQPPQNCAHLQPLLQMWWNIFCEKVHPQLSPVMATSTLAPNWHEYAPMHFHSSILKAPLHTDMCDDSYAGKPDFSEFKDPWEDYPALNEPITDYNVQKSAMEGHTCPAAPDAHRSGSEPQSDHSSQHHTEPHYAEHFSHVKDRSFLESEHRHEASHHIFTQTVERSHVESTGAKKHHPQSQADCMVSETKHFQPPERNTQPEPCHPHQEVHASHDPNYVAHYDSQHHSTNHNRSTTWSQEAVEHGGHQHQSNFDRGHQDQSQNKPHHNDESVEHHHCHEYRPSSPDRLSYVQPSEHHSTSHHESSSTPECQTSSRGEHLESEDQTGQLSINRNAERSDNTPVMEQTGTQNITSPSDPCTESRTVATQSDVNVTEGLESENAGLAGALAQMTLGERRSAEQIALEEHMRKQSWEHGQIDYMGRDSFDNIWKKICETLALASPRSTPPRDIPLPGDKDANDTEKEKVEVDHPDEAAVHLTQPESVVSFRGEQILVQEQNTITVRECNPQSPTDVPEENARKPSDMINTPESPLEDNLRASPLKSASEVDVSSEQAPVEVLSCSSKDRTLQNSPSIKPDVQQQDVVAGQRNLQQAPCSTHADIRSNPLPCTETSRTCPIVLNKPAESPVTEKIPDSRVLEETCANVTDKQEIKVRDDSPYSQKPDRRTVVSSGSPISGRSITKPDLVVIDSSIKTCERSVTEQVEFSVSETNIESVSRQCQETLAAIEDSETENQKASPCTDVLTDFTLSPSTAGTVTLTEETIFGTKEDETVGLTEKLESQDAQGTRQGALQSQEVVDNTILSDILRSEFGLHSLAESLNQSIEPEAASGVTVSQAAMVPESEVASIDRTSPLIVQLGETDRQIVVEEVTNIAEGTENESESTVPTHRHDIRTEKKVEK